MKSPEITVFTATYNRAHTLTRVYKSLENQTFRDFEWLIIDDGSTDDTEKIISLFTANNSFPIRYYQQNNQHKLLTVFDGVDLAKGKYFMIVDSDDALPETSLEILTKEFKNIPEDSDIVFVAGLSQDQNKNIIGDMFPTPPHLPYLDCSIFNMRYKYRCKGDRGGMGLTDIYKKMIIPKERLSGKGFIPEGVFQYQFDTLGKHRFINKVIRTYIRDDKDKDSLSNTFYDDKNAFGLAENYKTFINIYRNKALKYPKVILRNLLGYILFSSKYNKTYRDALKDIQPFWGKIIVGIVYPFRRFFKHKTI